MCHIGLHCTLVYKIPPRSGFLLPSPVSLRECASWRDSRSDPSPPPLMRQLLGYAPLPLPCVSDPRVERYASRIGLNRSQTDAVMACVQSKGVHLITGPPGTGVCVVFDCVWWWAQCEITEIALSLGIVDNQLCFFCYLLWV